MSILLINGSYRALINGSYRAKGAQPDGDSIHFVPENPGEWNLVGGILRRSGAPPARPSCHETGSPRWRPHASTAPAFISRYPSPTCRRRPVNLARLHSGYPQR
jgi:hypothetical protein